MKKKQTGFSILEIILIIVLVGVLSGAGWLVLKRNKTTEKEKPTPAVTQSTPDTTKVTTPTSQAKIDESDKWLLFTSADSKYKIRLVDGQEFRESRTSNGASYLSATVFMPKAGTSAVVKPLEGGKDAVAGVFIGMFSTLELDQPRGEKQTGFKTKSGLEVEEYDFVQTEEPNGIDITKGGKENSYLVHKGDKTLRVLYGYFDSENNTTYIDNVEKMVKSVEIM